MNLTVEKTDFIIHEKYDDKDYSNDIALIRLASEIPYNNDTNFISLPTRAEANANLVGKSANVSGFGKYSDSK